MNNFLEIYSCRVKQIFKSRLYEVCENLCVEPIDIIKSSCSSSWYGETAIIFIIYFKVNKKGLTLTIQTGDPL